MESADSAQQSSQTNQTGTARVKRGMAEMLKGGVIMDVVTPEEAKIAEDAGAAAVMALERVPAMIRAEGGVARMANPKLIREITTAARRMVSLSSSRRRVLMSPLTIEGGMISGKLSA